MKRLILAASLLLTVFPLISSNRQYIYTQIAQEEGLTSTVNCVYKETDGNVWIGTPRGLFSFDGYNLKYFSQAMLNNRTVYQVCKDNHGTLWVLTDKHLLKRDDENRTFVKINPEDTPFYSIACDDDGIWVGSLNNIYRYSYHECSFELFCSIADNFDCRHINLLDESTLLCCSHQGKVLIDIASKEISENPFGTEKEVSAALVDSGGHIWLAFYNKGIEVFSPDGTKVKSYNTANSGLSNNIVLCLEEKGQMVLAGTDGGGINIIDPSNNRIRVISHISGDSSSFPAYSIKSLFTDYYGDIWAGSIRDGLIRVSQSEMVTYNDTYMGHTTGLSTPTVLCIHQDRVSDHIWIGTDGEGLNRFYPATHTFRHFPNTFKTKVVSIADYSDKELAISVYADNILIFDKVTEKTRKLPIDNKELTYQIRHSARNINLFNEKDGDLLIFSNNVYRYDKATGRCSEVHCGRKKKINSNFHSIGVSDTGVWMHDDNNIYILKEDSDTLILKGSHTKGSIRSGHLAVDGTIWLATEEGLCNFDTDKGSFVHIKTTIFSDATAIVCDRHSRVWIGTNNGLSAYLTESGSFAMFGKSDGVQPNEFLSESHLLSSNGDVYMGGVHGLLHIGENYTIEKIKAPVLKLENISVDGKKILIKEGESFIVPRHSEIIDIFVSTLQRDMFRHRVFRFSVSGQIQETPLPVLSLQQLPNPGKHEITVSCTCRNGEWSEPVRLMTLKVPQPWYFTWWFICLCLAFLLTTYLSVIYTINRRKSSELKMAIKEQEQKVYEEKVRMLINISHELRTPLTLIMAPLKRLLKSMDPEAEQVHTLNRIYRQSRRMRSLLDMVLDLRKMEVGSNRIKLETVDYNRWITDMADDIVNEERSVGISIVYDFDPSVKSAMIDRQKCDIVMMNVLINAIKHSKEGDTITIGTKLLENGYIRTSISDQGPGLGEDIDPAKLFTQFYQSNSEVYGSGIGLSYSKILVELHGGNIGADNNPDTGATFWWDIPATTDGTVHDVESRAYLNELLGHSFEEASIAAVSDGFSTSGMKLMLIDDNNDLLEFLKEALCQDFAEIITATGGHKAIKELNSGRMPDIIVSDVNMPEGDGFWLCRELKTNEKFRHIPFVLLTARGEDKDQSDSYRLGADGFLAKPFEIETLMELIRGLLRNKAEIRKRYLGNETDSETGYGSNEERFIINLNRIISEHLSDPDLDQQLICMELGVSRALLYNKMKAITGAGAKEYITKIRIEKAKSLIEKTSLTIAEISEMTGFASQSYFSTAFKNYTGMTPSQYKQNCKTV